MQPRLGIVLGYGDRIDPWTVLVALVHEERRAKPAPPKCRCLGLFTGGEVSVSVKARRVLVPIAAAFAVMLSLLTPAGAQGSSDSPPGANDNGNVCSDEFGTKTNGGEGVTITASEGYVFEWVCVKAGSGKDGKGKGQGEGCGPAYNYYSPSSNITSVPLNTICPAGISHYSYKEVPAPEPPCEETNSCPPPSCEETNSCPPPPCEETNDCPEEEEPSTTTTTTKPPEPEPEPEEDPTGVLGAGAANAQVGTPSFTG